MRKNTIEPTEENIRVWRQDYGYNDNDIDTLHPVNDDCKTYDDEDIEIIDRVLK